MSRSYKKNPVYKENSKNAKRSANKKVRQYKDGIANGKSYRRIYWTGDIYEYSWFIPYREYRKSFYKNSYLKYRFGWETEADCYNHWEKLYLRK
jgi:hypothetical protein